MLTFKNDGILDTRAITTFGVSAKSKENAIGYFGTGLKYAIAILLREGCEIQIYTGNQHLTFYTEKEDFRNKEFEFIGMHSVHDSGVEKDTELPFTTELGKNWDIWQAFREIYCNCIDESGEVKMELGIGFEQQESSKDKTIIMVKGLDKIWQNRHEIVLASEPVYYCNKTNIEIHAGRSRFLYYQGIKVYEFDSEMKHTYNFTKDVTLTEDRTISSLWSVQSGIAECLSQCTKEELLSEIFFEGCAEHKLDYDYIHQQPSTAFKAALTEAKQVEGARINLTAIGLDAKFTPKKPITYPEIVLNEQQQTLFDNACFFLMEMGIDVTEFPITFHEVLAQEGVMGQANMEKNTIKVTSLAFTMGRKQLVSTLLEEYVHLKHRYKDCERPMQSFLFDSWLGAEEKIQGVNL